jgi:hypothetical protein
MNRQLTLIAALSVLFMARAAVAQEVQLGYQGLPYKSTGETNTGIQVSDGVLMHVGAGAEVGYDTNVFYQSGSSQLEIGSGIVRTTVFGELTNATRTGTVPSGLSFDARAGLQYRRYTSNDALVAPYQNAFMPSAGLSLGTSTGPTVSFSFADNFLRLEDPPYNPGVQLLIRDNNQASAEVRWAPGGGRISATFRYTNMVDIFETNQYSFADSLSQELMVDAAWKWLPKTALFAQVRQGYISYLNNPVTMTTAGAALMSPPKYSSFPLHAIIGLRGLVTEKIAALAAVGYANAFYSCSVSASAACVSTSGILGSSYANVELTYRPTMLARIVGGWRSDFQNSVISTFYYGQQFYASYVQQVAGRAALDLSGMYQRRNYQGYLSPLSSTAQPRVDNFFQVGATLDYFLRNWAYAGIGYALVANESGYTLPTTQPGLGSVNYAKNQVFARLGLTY